MIISEKQFYTEELDYKIPAMERAKELYLAGDVAGAEHTFAEYFKTALDPEHYFEGGHEIGQGSSTQDVEYSIIENADRICRGIVRSCSYTHDFGGDIDWSFNGTPDGYREWLWQLNRHNVFKIIAYAYLETGDEKYAECFNRNMKNWIEKTECPQWPVPNRSSANPNWRTISAGIRQSGNWPYAIHAFLKSPSVSDRTWVLIAMSIWEHGQLLMHSPSSLNWLDIEMSGLNALGSIYRFFRLSETWRKFAVDTMASELKTQVYEDGFQCELTTGYQSVVTSTNIGVYRTATRYGFDIPDDFKQDIRKLYTMYPKLMRPDGRTPCTNDGGQVLVSDRMTEALKYFPGDPEFTAVLEGRPGDVYPLDVVMPWSGMITMRTGWGEKDVWMFFESAPYGAGHQHDDKLNVNLSAYGKNILNVIGNHAYDGSEMRKLTVRTRGHNSGIVDGKGQNARPTHTAWSPEKVNIKSDLEVNITEDTVVAYGKYNRGYGGDLIPVTHERKVVFFRSGLEGSLPFFVLLDSFTPGDDQNHTYELSFPLYPIPVTLNGRRATLNCGDGVTMEVVTHAALCTVTAQNGPEYMGFRPAEDRLAKEHIPAPVLIIRDRGGVKHFATVLYPTPDGKAPEITVTCDAESFTVTLDGKEHKFARDEEFLVTKPV